MFFGCSCLRFGLTFAHVSCILVLVVAGLVLVVDEVGAWVCVRILFSELSSSLKIVAARAEARGERCSDCTLWAGKDENVGGCQLLITRVT